MTHPVEGEAIMTIEIIGLEEANDAMKEVSSRRLGPDSLLDSTM